MKKILFISHEATRTGAPLILLNLIKWLGNNDRNIQFDVLLLNGGNISDDFKKVCHNVYIYSNAEKTLRFSEIFKEKLKSKFRIKKVNKDVLFFNEIALKNYDIIYANSIASIPFGVRIKHYCKGAKLIAHIHELPTIIKLHLPQFGNYIKDVDQYIAVSQLVADNLVDNYTIDRNLIDIIYEFGVINEQNVEKDNKVFTVGAAGTTHWRKGDDIFIQIASYINKNYPNAKIEFVWVGSTLHNRLIIESDLEKLGLMDKVRFVGEQGDPIQFYKNFDVFLLTSREDPFPLVCIETATLGIPIICFEKASGTTEVINKGGGFVVPYLDIQEMSEKVMLYYDNSKKRDEDGRKAKELFNQFSIDKIAPLLYETIRKQLNN
ncbi:glycosyltransferase [Flavobacterium sharifuzzamanii]|uniref:glycosyltransferase n=1 Tax=Flavobacterium sharifuzzamanii TaxID=2211133 RepID=UPI000DAF16F5|nr:glycosyltransferase [Flavobacterium sharifuzzamanii]KAF2081172.1 glycosyltransferase [Flavobacterium sharifuzzamanii]